MQKQWLTRSRQLFSPALFFPNLLLLRVYQDLPDVLISRYNANMVADDTIGKLWFQSRQYPTRPSRFRHKFPIHRPSDNIRSSNISINKFWLLNTRGNHFCSVNCLIYKSKLRLLRFACIMTNLNLHGSDLKTHYYEAGLGQSELHHHDCPAIC